MAINLGGYASQFGTDFINALTKAYITREQRKQDILTKQQEYQTQAKLETVKDLSSNLASNKIGLELAQSNITMPVSKERLGMLPSKENLTNPANFKSPEEYANFMVEYGKDIQERPQLGQIAPKVYESNMPQEPLRDIPALETAIKQDKLGELKKITNVEGIEKKMPTGYAKITNPEALAKIWNQTYNDNLTAKDFENIQERPYFQPIVNRDGEIKIFDTRTGEYKKGVETVYKGASDTVKTSISALNDNLLTIDKIEKINNKGDMTGAITGRTFKLGAKFFNEPEFVTMKNTIAQLRSLVYGLSGKQINESELKWLQEDILPHIEQPDQNFDVALKTLKGWIKQRKGTILQQYPNIKDMPSIENTSAGQNNSTYKIGDPVMKGGQTYKVVGFDTDGEPLVE